MAVEETVYGVPSTNVGSWKRLEAREEGGGRRDLGRRLYLIVLANTQLNLSLLTHIFKGRCGNSLN